MLNIKTNPKFLVILKISLDLLNENFHILNYDR